MNSRPSYKIGPPDLSMQMTFESGISLPFGRPIHQGRERFKTHKEYLIEEKCHIYAGVLFCFCGECKDRE